MRYFMSKTSDVKINWREAIGGFYELMFLNDQNDYWKTKAKQNQSQFYNAATIPLTQDLTHLKSRFGDNTNNFIYFFCPFINPDAQSAEFEIQFILNKNPIELKNKDILDNEVYLYNTGQATPDSQNGSSTQNPFNSDVKSMSQKAVDIIKEVKGDENVEGVRKRMEEAPEKYFEVIQRDVKADLWNKKSADVKNVNFIIIL